tara:strand:+ start:77 stop:313 length:237 start_codon:yes stop_codon:yes gene_type:complete
MKVKHNCPYIELKKYCNHQAIDPFVKYPKFKRKCGYSNPSKCPLLKDSKSALVNMDVLDNKIDSMVVSEGNRGISDNG